MPRPNNILILSAGRRVELMQAFQSALAQHRPGAAVICADLQPELSSACQMAGQFERLPHVYESDYIARLSDLCARLAIGLIVPTIDTELSLLAEHRAMFGEHSVTVLVSAPELVAQCRDKRRTAALFEQLGIPTPTIYDAARIEFPCFTKPASGSSSIGAMRLDTPGMLTEALLADPDRMFMALIPTHWREVTFDLYYDKTGALRCLVPRERIATRAGEVAKGVTRRDWLYDPLREAMLRIEGARGCLTLQLFADDETRRFSAIEINARFGGGYPLSHAAGADFPDWAIREYLLDETIDWFDGWEADLLMLRYDAKTLTHGYR